jgi:predicted transport protein
VPLLGPISSRIAVEEDAMAKSPEDMTATMIANMKEKTGRTLDEWLEVARASGEHKHGAIVKHLKGEHGMTHGFANLVALRVLASEAGSGGDPAKLVDEQYAGDKAHLRPIYQAIVDATRRLGGDVQISPKKTYVSLRRSKQFAIVQPTTRTRIDLGLNLKGRPVTERLEAARGFNSMVSHRVRVKAAAEVDAELERWLADAYAQA